MTDKEKSKQGGILNEETINKCVIEAALTSGALVDPCPFPRSKKEK